MILKYLRGLTSAMNTYLLVLDHEKNQLKYWGGTGEFQNEEDFKKFEMEKKSDILDSVLADTKIYRKDDYTIAPLWVQDKSIGLLGLKQESIVTQESELLDVFAHHVAFAIENRRLQREIEQKQAMEHELNLASRIQNTLLPKSFPKVPNLEIYGLTKSAKEIGGDYFDVLQSGQNLHFCIGMFQVKGFLLV